MKINGARVRSARQFFRMTQLDVAAAAKITMATLSKIESGKEPSPQLSTINAIAKVLQCNPIDLLMNAPEETFANEQLVRNM